MKKFATALTVPLCLGLAVAQESPTTPQSSATGRTGHNSQTWYGVLVDSRCSSSGMASGNSGSMPKSTAMSQTTPTGNDSLMNRTTPAQSGRDVNTTDRNTSGVADRVGATAGNTAGSRDMNRTTGASDTRATSSSERTTSSNDISRGTATDRQTAGDVDHNAADRRSPSDLGRATPTDMARSTTAASTGNPTDTQVGNNPRGSLGDVAAGNWDRSCFVSPSSSSFVLQLQDGRTMKIDDAGNSRISSQLQSTGRVSTKNKVFRVKVTGTAEGDTLHITDIQM